MRRKIKGSFEEWISDQYSMIYMEIQELSDDTLLSGRGLPRPTLWHLEDEIRKLVAQCGLPLPGVCKAVSPALAMLGTPCPDCTAIVRKWLHGPNGARTRKLHFEQLVGGDKVFRESVQGTVPPGLFTKRFDKHRMTDSQLEQMGIPISPKRKKASSSKKRK